jgi:hypothetical protein
MYSASIADMESELHTTPAQISWSLSLFILFHGNIPLLWSAIRLVESQLRGVVNSDDLVVKSKEER